MSEWSDWFVYRVDGAPVGPLSTKAVAEAILAGRLPPDCWVAAPGGTRWLRALDVPVIAALLGGIPTRRRASGMRMVTAPIPASREPATPAGARADALPPKLDDTLDLSERGDAPARSGRHDDTIKTTRSSSPSPSPPTVRSVDPRGPDGFPIPPPPSSSSPTPPSGYRRGSETLESPAVPPIDPPPWKKTQGA
ncbi:MAG: hypothetical protein KF782_02200 [Labilithrix sp.]|nr:hypothetical protein [Labilithrix sp.]